MTNPWAASPIVAPLPELRHMSVSMGSPTSSGVDVAILTATSGALNKIRIDFGYFLSQLVCLNLSCSLVYTWFTSLTRSASAASILRPVIINSLVMPGPTSLGSRCVLPRSGITPN